MPAPAPAARVGRCAIPRLEVLIGRVERSFRATNELAAQLVRALGRG
jgi:hypothetical protein